MVLRFRDLGTLDLERDGAPVRVVGHLLTALLASLLVRATQRVTTDSLIDALWGEQGMPAGARLDPHITRLRRLIEPDHQRGKPFQTLINDTGGYRLLVAPDQVDSLQFEQIATHVRDTATARPDQTRAFADQALALWRGLPWEPHTHESWAAPAATRLLDLRADVAERRIEALLATGEPGLALADLETLIAEQPLRERLWALRMLAAHQAGDIDEALATYGRARRVLLDEIGIDPGPELQDLHARILADDPTLVTRPRAAVIASQPDAKPKVEVRLPAQRRRLVGRADDTSELSTLLSTQSLVTVVGPAGCGKTSLAIHVARRVAENFPDGVCFVDLTIAVDEDQVADTVASTLGVATSVGTDDVLTALARAVAGRAMLIVIDNCEHVLDGAARLVDVMLEQSVGPTLLATSREALDVNDETVLTLSPLKTPVPDVDGDFALDPERLDDQPAVELFLERLKAGGPHHGLGPTEIGFAARICAELDGLPLAIELAASQARSFSLAEIADRVRADPADLARVGRGGQRHHASLRGAIESSSAALSDDERAMQQAVSVIPGPFTVQLAAALADTTTTHASNLLSRLVHRSMLTPLGPRQPGQPSRFAQLATIRAYAIATLSSSDLAALEQRRNRWVHALVDAAPETGHRSELHWHSGLDDDLSAIRATLHHTLVSQPHPMGAFIAARLGYYWYYRSMNVEWERWVRLGASSPAADEPDRLTCAVSRIGAASFMGRRSQGIAELAAAVERLPPGESVLAGHYLLTVALSSELAKDYDTSNQFAAAGIRLASITGGAHLDLLSQTAQALASGGRATPAERLAAADRLHRRAAAMDNLFVLQTAATSGTSSSLMAGDTAAGLRWSERSLALSALLGVGASGHVAELRGAHLVRAGCLEEAVEFFTASQNLARWAGRTWPVYPTTEPLLTQAREQLSTADYQAAEQRGQTLTVSQLAARASSHTQRPSIGSPQDGADSEE